MALGFSTNSFAFGLSLDLVTLIGVVEGGGGCVAGVTAADPAVEGVVGPAGVVAGVTTGVGGVLAGVGVRCSTLSCLLIMLAVGGEAFR